MLKPAVSARTRGIGGLPSRWVASLAAVLMVSAGTVALPALFEPVAAQVSCADVAASQADAVRMARTCDRLVQVGSATSERSLLSVRPTGEFVWEQSAGAVRVRQGGGWRPVDTSLVLQADGSLAPVATVTRLRFSKGGPIR